MTLHDKIAENLVAVMPKLDNTEKAAYKKAVIRLAVEETLKEFPELHEVYGKETE